MLCCNYLSDVNKMRVDVSLAIHMMTMHIIGDIPVAVRLRGGVIFEMTSNFRVVTYGIYLYFTSLIKTQTHSSTKFSYFK